MQARCLRSRVSAQRWERRLPACFNIMHSPQMKLGPLPKILTDLTIREGSQQEIDLKNATVAQKLELLSLITQTGLKKIELTAFGPLFPDREELVRGAQNLPNDFVIRALYFNTRGLDDLLKYPRVAREGIFHTAATAFYRVKNYAQGIFDAETPLSTLADVTNKMEGFKLAFRKANLEFDTVLISSAWGDKSEQVSIDQFIDFTQNLLAQAEKTDESGQKFTVRSLTIADTVGSAKPAQIKDLFLRSKATWPDKILRAHIHPATDASEDCVLAGVEGGVDEWEAAWGGVGGSPKTYEQAGGNLDIRYIIQAWNKLGAEHGLNLQKIEELIKYLRQITKREIEAVSL